MKKNSVSVWTLKSKCSRKSYARFRLHGMDKMGHNIYNNYFMSVTIAFDSIENQKYAPKWGKNCSLFVLVSCNVSIKDPLMCRVFDAKRWINNQIFSKRRRMRKELKMKCKHNIRAPWWFFEIYSTECNHRCEHHIWPNTERILQMRFKKKKKRGNEITLYFFNHMRKKTKNKIKKFHIQN